MRKKMLQVLATRDTSHDQTGAAVVAIVFLSVFVVLILGDAVLTAFALNKALTKDERETELMQRLKSKEEYLDTLRAAIAKAEHDASKLRGIAACTHPSSSSQQPPVVPGSIVSASRLPGMVSMAALSAARR